MEKPQSALAHEVSKFSKRIFVWTIEKSCREHGNHSELSVVVPLDYIRMSTLYRIASNKKRFYLSTRTIDLWDELGRDSPTIRGRPTWLGKFEDSSQDREQLDQIVNRIKEALRKLVEAKLGSADGWCSKDWVSMFIKEEEVQGIFCGGRLLRLRETVAKNL
ncbi:hypothetical protein PTTG_27616 [Puccinia triticina 1-1 BBBD Race 1]|uniref:Uncharacterized protein n=2 Tax=Puccinia triticina TaxID=208348 RepID=A0A180GI95_PUCT1|nr:uncharacterized protein PtA15_18A24 [Puccinia triticina]OAV92466.1 hypothetical protein PTTG_27616 [Puccinia triticina 1-1 BBBD Race 1]WAQ92969.1 hypothetical protein PtA15_18A24 [Puccinia triticina]